MLDLDLVPDDSPLSLSSPPATSSAAAQNAKRRRAALPVHRCRFPDWSPSAIAALAITPTSFDAGLLGAGGSSAERGVVAVGRANGDVELMIWGGHQGWVAWRTLPSSFPLAQHKNSKKPTALLSHLVFTHQTTLSDSDLELYSGDLAGAEAEIRRLSREGVRLFGVGGVGSELVEWEWGGPGASKEIGRVKSTLPTLPPIFALAASRASSQLAIGCEDSTIRILNIQDDELELIAKIEVGGPGKVRALSLAWGGSLPPSASATASKGKSRDDSPEPASDLPASFATAQDSYLVAGCSNSSIRRFDLPQSGSPNGVWRASHRMKVDQLKGEHTVVWAVAVLADGTLVSGDSMGNVKFWDGKMGTQSQSFKSHKADVLCLAVGSDGSSVFSSGVDQKTTEFKQVNVGGGSSRNTSRWIQSSGRRLHSHDVRAMVLSPPYTTPLPHSRAANKSATSSRQVPILTSGGLDLSLIIVPAASAAASAGNSSRPLGKAALAPLANPVSSHPSIEFESTVHRRAAYVPHRSRPFSIAAEGRLLVGRRERELAVWQLEQPKLVGQDLSAQGKSGWKVRKEQFGILPVPGVDQAGAEDEEEVASTPGWQQVAEMSLKLQTNLIASAVSADGKWLAVSDLFETKLFKLALKNGELVPRRQKTFSTSLSAALPASLGTGSSALTFTRNSQRLILATSFGSSIAVVELPTSRDADFEVVQVFTQHSSRSDGQREIINGRVGTNGTNGKHADGDVSMDVDSDADSDSDSEESVSAGAKSSSGDKPATVCCLSVSNDGKWLASADLERKVCVFDLDSLKHHSTLPTPAQIPAALAFLPTTPTIDPTLLIGLPNNAVSLFDLSTRRFHQWALPLASLKTNTLMDLREPLLGVSFEPRDESNAALSKVHESRRQAIASEPVAVLWGANWVAKIDLEEVRTGQTPATKSKKAPLRREADKKRARDEDDDLALENNGAEIDGQQQPKELEIRMTRRYQPLVLFDFVGVGELVAVERTWFDIAKELPPAFSANGQFAT